MNIEVHVSFQIISKENVFSFSLDIYPGMEFLDLMVVLFVVFKEPAYCFPYNCNFMRDPKLEPLS